MVNDRVNGMVNVRVIHRAHFILYILLKLVSWTVRLVLSNNYSLTGHGIAHDKSKRIALSMLNCGLKRATLTASLTS